ncbi:MAG TPA: hypothetical protein VFH56_10385 [Acidimicrobiales bacterium]|nr:hypothetical protein [Acidimicrobiales bacterium]
MATPNLNSITNVTPGILGSAQLASGDNTLFTVAAGKAAKLSPLILVNTSATASVAVSVSVIPAGGSVDGTHKVISGYTMQPGETVTVDELQGMWLGDGDKVSVNAATAAVVDATLTGLVFA